MSRLAKFFIICAAVCVLGIVMTFAGYAAGGVDDLQKVADKHEWLNVGPNSTETDVLEVGEFQSIEAEGSLDIAVLAPASVKDEAAPDFVEDMYYEGAEGTVVVRWGKGNGAPVVTNEDGVLKIKGSTDSIDNVEVNLTGDDPSPDVVVFCSDNELESININGKYGDTAIAGVKSKSTKVNADSGDIEIEDVEGGELTAQTQTGDIAAGSNLKRLCRRVSSRWIFRSTPVRSPSMRTRSTLMNSIQRESRTSSRSGRIPETSTLISPKINQRPKGVGILEAIIAETAIGII